MTLEIFIFYHFQNTFDFLMETKFNSFVESFYLLLEDNDYVKAREQVDIMKTWCAAYMKSLDELDESPECKQIRANCALYQQVVVNDYSSIFR